MVSSPQAAKPHSSAAFYSMRRVVSLTRGSRLLRDSPTGVGCRVAGFSRCSLKRSDSSFLQSSLFAQSSLSVHSHSKNAQKKALHFNAYTMRRPSNGLRTTYAFLSYAFFYPKLQKNGDIFAQFKNLL